MGWRRINGRGIHKGRGVGVGWNIGVDEIPHIPSLSWDRLSTWLIHEGCWIIITSTYLYIRRHVVSWDCCSVRHMYSVPMGLLPTSPRHSIPSTAPSSLWGPVVVKIVELYSQTAIFLSTKVFQFTSLSDNFGGCFLSPPLPRDHSHWRPNPC